MSPIGVPKVSYRMPGEAVTQWVDLYNRLYRDRILFLGSDLDDELANQLVGIMVFLNAEDASQDLFLYINSPGGAISSGFAVFDTMQHIDATVHTICVGIAASMASLVLAGGDKGCRLAFPHSRIMVHQPAGGGFGQASDILLETSQVAILRYRVKRMYVKITGEDAAIIKRDLDRDNYFTPSEAMRYGDFGIIDSIAEEVNLMAYVTMEGRKRETLVVQQLELNWFNEDDPDLMNVPESQKRAN